MIATARQLLQRHRLARFVVVSVLNTAFGFAVYSAVILLRWPVWAALAAGNVAGLCFNFLTTGGYVFRSLVLSRFPAFASVYLLVYLFNWLLIHWLSDVVQGPIVAQAILTAPMAGISYLLLKKMVFAGAGADRSLGR